MASKNLILILALYICVSKTLAIDNVLCYYESWAEYDFPPEDIDVNICTHVNFAFIGISKDGSLRLDNDADLVRRVSALKSKNPSLKVLFSVGGASAGSATFSTVARTASAKQRFAEDSLDFLQKYNFDGIDVDWEYPAQFSGSSSADKENFIDLLWVLRDAFNDNGGYLLTVAVAAEADGNSYNFKAISKVVDFINIMTYDFHSPYDGDKTGQNSPLYASSSDDDWERDNENCDAAISNWLNTGIDVEKTVLGLGFYGQSYRLANANNHGVGAATKGEGSQSADSYREICQLGWTEVWDDEQDTPYKYSGDQWIGYDNPRSIAMKVQYAKKRGLGGVMMWAVDQDDNKGRCGTKNALLNTVKENL